MRRGIRAGLVLALCIVGAAPVGGSAATIAPQATATQVLSISKSSSTLDFVGTIGCLSRTGTYRGTTLGAAARDSAGTWIAATLLVAEGSSDPSVAVNGEVVDGSRNVRTIGSGTNGWIYSVTWVPTDTVNLKPPYTLHFSVGSFGQKLSQCTMTLNGTQRPISSTGRGGYVDLGAAQGNVAAINRGTNEQLRLEAWVPSGLRTVTLRGGKFYGSAVSAPVSRVVAWKPSPAGADAPYAVLDGWSFGGDAATRLDLVNAGGWITGQGLAPPAFAWFDLG